MSTEEQARKEYAEAGVDLPELKEEPKEEPAKDTPPEPEKPEPATDPEKKDEPEDPEAPLPETPKEEHKPRSIYDDFKGKKAEAKALRAIAVDALRAQGIEIAGTETVEQLQEKLQAISQAKTPAEKRDAKDDLEAFAAEINADPAMLKRLRDILFKDAPKALSEEDRKALETAHKAHERQMFDDEFKALRPTLKEYFPGATGEELKAMKKELDTISHTKEWHDKPLDYIAFKHREKLGALVSPKKRGIEPKDRKDAPNDLFEFDPEADLSKMTPEEREKWETEYRNATKTDGLQTDAQGRKLLV